MSKDFKVPELGENIESATVSKVLVSKGDYVEKDQSVVELETDKAVTEVPCDIEGTVEKIHVAEGDEIEVGQTILTLDGTEGGKTEKKEKETDTSATQESRKKDEQRKSGKEQKEEPEQIDQSDQEEKPAENEEPGEEEKKPEKKPKQEPGAGEPGQKEQRMERSRQPEPDHERADKPLEEPAPAAPSVRRFAREVGVDIQKIRGSGPNGRISIDDIKTRLRSGEESAEARVSPDLPDFSMWGEIEREPMTKVRRLTADHVSRAWTAVPHAVQFGKADVTYIEELRENFKEEAREAGGHLSVTVLLVKTVAGALKAFPKFNASVDDRHDEIIFKKYCHIGIAMDTERGLVAPVIRNADQKSVLELSVELKELTQKAREGKLSVDEMQGGTFSITNAGALGGDLFIPIVHWPQVAILGVARTATEIVFQQGEYRSRRLLPLSLSYDHRIIDGADGVRFMRWIINALENPVQAAWKG
jgi:pyruvate dehydrogenase E2 component (dihydrolipoamide acetyltransferase)